MRNPRATQDVLGFRQAYRNLLLMPRSRIRNGALMATRIGPQRIAAFAGSKGTLNIGIWINFEGSMDQSMTVPMIKEPAPIPAK